MIVGGTSGIGLGVAEAQIKQGRQVVITGRSEDKLAAALDRLGGSATGQVVDAGDAAATTAFFGGLGVVDHVVITVSRSGGVGPFREFGLDALRTGVEGKLYPQAITAQAALEVLRPDGSLTFVSAASAGAAYPGTAALAAVNAAVNAMVPVLAVELAPLRVNAVSPGVVDTAWWDFLAETREATFATYAESTPVGRVGRPEDVAGAIGYLIDNTFTSGVVLPCDGGSPLSGGRRG